jgi:adenylate cyclase
LSTATLGRACGLAAARFEAALVCLQQADLLVAGETGELRFWHPLTRDAAYASLVAADRRRMHSAAARALTEQAGDRLDEVAPLVATHHEAAEEFVDAAVLRIRAGAAAYRRDFTESALHLRAALTLLTHAPDTEDALRLGTHARTLLVRMASRAGFEREEFAALLARAQPDAQALGDQQLALGLANGRMNYDLWSGDLRAATASSVDFWRLLDANGMGHVTPGITGLLYLFAGPLHGLVERVEASQDALGEDRTVHPYFNFCLYDALSVIRIGALLYTGRPAETATALGDAERAFAARPTAEWHVWALSYWALLADLTGCPDHLHDARRAAEDAIRLAGEAGSVASMVKATWALGLCELLAGRPDAAVGAMEQALRQVRKHRTGRHEEGHLLAHLARAHWATGDAARARRLAGEAVELSRIQGARVPECVATLTLSHILRCTADGGTDLDRAATLLTEAETLITTVGASAYLPLLQRERALLSLR